MHVPRSPSLWRQFLLAGSCVALCVVQDSSAIRGRGQYSLLQPDGSPQRAEDSTSPPLLALSHSPRGRGFNDSGQHALATDVVPESALESQKIYTGIGSCSTNPCGEAAYCRDYPSGHGCTCHLGFFWDGQQCVSIRENNLCAPGEPVDVNVQNVYECTCSPGYEKGTSTLPNGADVETCVRVTCPEAYYLDGDTCKPATDDLCSPGELGEQQNRNEYTCTCPETHFVETFVGAGDVNLQRCTPDPCYQQCSPGTCTRSPSEASGYTCRCPENYSVATTDIGQVCKAGPCAGNPCGLPEEGHTCTATSDAGYTCSCAEGYIFNGTSCAQPAVNPCTPGTVVATGEVNGYTCRCPAGYVAEEVADSGEGAQQRCSAEPAVDVCNNKCEFGTCSPSPREGSDSPYHCECEAGYSVSTGPDGEYCEPTVCSSNPCGAAEAGHVCQKTGETTYACTCARGFFFNGKTCEQATNTLCSPGELGEQQNRNEYTCTCPETHFVETFVGAGDVNLQRCTPDPCYQQCSPGTCTRSPSEASGYTCRCPENYSVATTDIGQVCKAGPCAGNPCGLPEEGHSCVTDGDSNYMCFCAPGYYFDGTSCKMARDELCSPGELGPQAVTNKYTCSCPEGFNRDKFMSDGGVTLERCKEDVCYNKCGLGTCIHVDSDVPTYRCICPSGYTEADDGKACVKDPCSESPCGPSYEGHKCTNEGDGYSCLCANGYFLNGNTCEMAINHRCWPGVVGPQVRPNEYTCKCPPSHMAEDFEASGGVTLQKCVPDPCSGQCGHGKCSRTASTSWGYTCECDEHYSREESEGGEFCKAGPCADSPCGNAEDGNQCTSTGESTYSCECGEGFYFDGASCQRATDDLCSPGTLGTVAANAYTCNCDEGYVAKDSTVAENVTLQSCVVDVCHNRCADGSCREDASRTGGYACDCFPGYSVATADDGEFCQPDPCTLHPCGEGAPHQCTRHDDTLYSCLCAEGYYYDGATCALPTDALCSPGTLGDLGLNAYSCVCPPGHKVERREVTESVVLESCAVDVCFNQCGTGACAENPAEPGGFTCDCPPGFTVKATEDGQFCEDDPCSLDPCGVSERAESCENTGGSSYACTCASGFFFDGTTCREATNDLCDPGELGPQTQVNEYTCICAVGTVAEDFESAGNVTLQRCVADACLHDRCGTGKCTRNSAAEFGYECECTPGFSVEATASGPSCVHDPCSLSPCGAVDAGHTCVNQGGEAYACTCAPGYYLNGTSCEPLSDSLCEAGTVQQEEDNTYTCECPETHQLQEYTGPAGLPVQRCVEDICRDQCLPGSCSYDSSKNAGYACICPPGYLVQVGAAVTGGERCLPDECPLDSCGDPEKVQLCLVVEGSPVCTCKDGYFYNKFTGKCTVENPCDYNVCGASEAVEKCNFLGGGKWSCECRRGFRLETANEEQSCVRASFCDGDPCGPTDVNRCVSTLKGYSCRCGAGYKLVRKPQMKCELAS
ncbi:putative EGF-like domain-containing protein [Neospora caninum Liverpool]|uniref:EGF-like domain-containing protein, putative n=1 Tax=Neospora caninum (strain Liverpool) TaxID=572307 RepID=F0VHF3_NEOCL|nr:putative EGF-like domain-containing protein [Neospora caninum Liverpool]CBZ53147.1 putative EGF-like domain-containing protein [Neospora caninum Liverpool]CEL67138.1 TPA: EGF-like domain-containing protein, putative [Neospora caninum Liverpool]|eukprot:XP_003883179.1 putative EGF-like domain-containing protein [Neospora caninum Liverpool]